MMKQYFLLIIISTIVFFNSVDSTNPDQCANLTNTDCKTCLSVQNCGFCKTKKQCFLYNGGNAFGAPCDTSDMQWETCVGRLIMIFGSLTKKE